MLIPANNKLLVTAEIFLKDNFISVLSPSFHLYKNIAYGNTPYAKQFLRCFAG